MVHTIVFVVSQVSWPVRFSAVLVRFVFDHTALYTKYAPLELSAVYM